MMVGIEDVGNATAGSETGDITEEEVVDFLEGGWVLDFVFLTDITKNEGVVDISDVAVFFGEVIVDVRTSKTTVHEVLVESGVGIVKCIIFNKFAEGERENFDRKGTAGEEGGKVAGEQEGVRAGDVDVILLGGVKAIDGFLEIWANLNFVDENEIAMIREVMLFDVIVQGVVFLEEFKINTTEVDMNDICVSNAIGNVLFEGIEEDGFAGTANASNNLDVGGTHNIFEGLEVVALNGFHMLPLL